MFSGNKKILTIGIIFEALAAVSFLLLQINMPGWLYYAGVSFTALGVVSIAAYILAPKSSAQPAPRNTPAPTAQNAPASTSASELMHNAQQSAPQTPLKERQPQQERAFPPPPNKDDQT